MNSVLVGRGIDLGTSCDHGLLGSSLRSTVLYVIKNFKILQTYCSVYSENVCAQKKMGRLVLYHSYGHNSTCDYFSGFLGHIRAGGFQKGLFPSSLFVLNCLGNYRSNSCCWGNLRNREKHEQLSLSYEIIMFWSDAVFLIRYVCASLIQQMLKNFPNHQLSFKPGFLV